MGRDRLIPKAVKAYDLSRVGYEAGRFSWLELIAAQQHLADIRMGYIEALQEAHLARLDILKFKKEGI
jgi:cobalt-zinc-cadmium efflux system outer membrane protein